MTSQLPTKIIQARIDYYTQQNLDRHTNKQRHTEDNVKLKELKTIQMLLKK